MVERDSDQQKVEAAALAVWQSVPDDGALKLMTPPRFYAMLADWDLTDAEAESAWWEFVVHREQVFGEGG